ncbi:MAG: Cobalt-containing nitrile hydratase subunit beta [Frankiales bacterium]|nr:Cobalt-containing nitrile hydratase subunit beta [Frankiales bacterium]
MSFRPGDPVRTSRQDPPHHYRVPRYARGALGVVVEHIGEHPLPYDRSVVEPVFTVRFPAEQLFGSGTHDVTVDVWETHLEAL